MRVIVSQDFLDQGQTGRWSQRQVQIQADVRNALIYNNQVKVEQLKAKIRRLEDKKVRLGCTAAEGAAYP